MKALTPRIFLSYTIGKPAHEETMRAVISQVRESLENEGIEVLDPITAVPREYSEISEDVYNYICKSDAMFVIEYPPVLNTSYEAGIAWAMGIPTFHWLPDHRPVHEREGLQEYLRYLGYRDGIISLPTDQGDRRYYNFPGDIASSNSAKTKFDNTIKSCLHSLYSGPLSDHAMRARRRFRDATNLGIKLLKEDSESPSLCWILNSLMRQHYEHLRDGVGGKKFVVDESVYLTFLATLNEHDESAKRVFAIADISSNIERFWFRGVDNIVGARIFRLPWTTFFNNAALNEFLLFAKGIADQYPVYVTDSDTREAYIQRLKSGISGDFLIFEDVVGYYRVDEFKSTKLVIEYDPVRSTNLRREFDRAIEVSTLLSINSSAVAVKREWIKRRRIGEWSEHYDGGDQRDEHYYENYDKNIRVWIPDYEELSAKVAAVVISTLTTSDLIAKATVGEIGVGTGWVTQIVARWCDALSRVGFKPIERYFCVDSSKEMCSVAEKAIHQFNSRNIFKTVRGLDFQGLLSASNGAKYDVVFGSLILHYVVDSTDQHDQWPRFFNDLDGILTQNGTAIFGGCFFDDDPDKRLQQITWWSNEMMRNGLDETQVSKFIVGNPEMCSMPSPMNIESRSNGRFIMKFDRMGPRKSPFGVLTLKRANN